MFFLNVSLNNFSMYCSCVTHATKLSKDNFSPRASSFILHHSHPWAVLWGTEQVHLCQVWPRTASRTITGEKLPLGEYPWVCDEEQKKHHTHTVSGAVQGLYLLELQGNQPVNHHISKCTSLINHHIHSFMAQVNWCMTDSLRLCSLFAISQVGLKERFHTKKKWSGDVTSCVHTQQRPHVVSLWKEQAMCYCVFSRRRRREKKKRN